MAKFASESGSGTLIAFWDGESRGTKNMIDTARRYGLHVIVVEYEKFQYTSTYVSKHK